MLLCTPIFRGSTSDDQLAKIIKIMGAPSSKQVHKLCVYFMSSHTFLVFKMFIFTCIVFICIYESICVHAYTWICKKIKSRLTSHKILDMNPGYRGPAPRASAARSLDALFSSRSVEQKLICDVLNRMFDYNPAARPLCIQACADPFFDELRTAGLMLPEGRPLPPLFNFYAEELVTMPEIDAALKVCWWVGISFLLLCGIVTEVHFVKLYSRYSNWVRPLLSKYINYFLLAWITATGLNENVDDWIYNNYYFVFRQYFVMAKCSPLIILLLPGCIFPCMCIVYIHVQMVQITHSYSQCITYCIYFKYCT